MRAISYHLPRYRSLSNGLMATAPLGIDEHDINKVNAIIAIITSGIIIFIIASY